MRDLIRKILLSELEIPNPVPGNTTITSRYGYRKHPTTGKNKMHYGIDISVNCNTDLKAPLDGEIIDIGQSNDECGGSITIKHNGFQTRYCHLSKILVNKGEKVFQGEVIGKTGGEEGEEGAGASTGCHLHMEVKNDSGNLDPEEHVKLSTNPTRKGSGDTIELNDKNPQIKTFKCFLVHAGYDSSLTIDENFDQKTVEVVKQLQKDLNLSQTGIITPDMIPLIKDKIQSLSPSVRRKIQNCYKS